MRSLIIIALLAGGFAMAEGGKNQKQRPVTLEEKTCIVFIPDETRLEGCTQVSSPDQAGFVAWQCPYPVLCPDDES